MPKGIAFYLVKSSKAIFIRDIWTNTSHKKLPHWNDKLKLQYMWQEVQEMHFIRVCTVC